jgi:hypothetical protein
MILFPVANFDTIETAFIKGQIVALPIEFLASSSEKFIAIEGQQAIAYAGTFSRTLLGNEVYWWIVLKTYDYTLRQLRYFRNEIVKVLGARTEEQFAEAAIERLGDQKFLQFCGFTEIARDDERILYEWTN